MIGLRLPDKPLAVLALGAHPDDIEIGCGGLLLTLAERPGVSLTSVVMTGAAHRLEEARNAQARFAPGGRLVEAGLPDSRLPAHWDEAKSFLERLAPDIRPDLLLVPRVDDAHQDHRLLGQLAPTVWRDALVLHYEIPKWDGDLGRPTHYLGLDETTARNKVRLLHECFPSQVDRDWWDDEMFFGLMRLRGMECRRRYAEGYYVTKAILEL